MSSYTGKRFVNPLNKKIGRRTGRDFRAGKNIRVGKDGFENFDDYFSESDADVTREFPRRHASTIREESESASTQESYSDEEYKENQPSHDNIVSQSVPNGTFSNTTYNNMTSSQSLSQGGQNRSKFGWLRNRDIGRRTGKNITANKQIRVDEQGFENFDDYFSESDMSSMSSRLSVSVVKPVPRQSAVSNLMKGDATPSLSLQHSQRHSSADEDESQGDDTDSQTELRDNTQTRAHIPESDTCHETTHTESEEENTIESNKTHSIHKHSNESETEHVDRTKQSRIYDEDSNMNDEDEEISEKRENTTNQMSRSHSHISQYVETPLSSKRNKSHISGVSDEYSNTKRISDSRGKYSNSKTSSDNTQTIKVDKNNASRQYESLGDEQSKSGKHKVSIGDHVSEKKIKTLDISKASNKLEHVDTEEDSEVEDEVETEYDSHSNVEAEQFDDDDRDDQDSYDESENETDQDENDDEHTESDKNEEVGNDDESDTNVSESENNTSNKRNRSLAESTANSEHREVRVTGSSTEKVVALTGKSDSRNVTEVQEAGDSEGVTDNESEDYEDDDDLRPSQAQTNIDVAGNKSGSITKLDIPTSVVNFNRTRKRLSYSAGEASEESQQRNKSRIEKANAELFETEVLLKSKEVRGQFQSIPTKDSTRNTNIVNSSKKVKDSETHADQSSEFLSLASRSTLPQQTQDIDDSEEDDIMVLDYARPKVTVGNGRNKSTRDKAKSQVIHLDTDSQSESEKQANTKNVKQGSKSEIKKAKPKNNAKGRRKTTHGSSKVNGLTVNLNFKKQNKKNVTDFEDQNLCEDGNDENHVENVDCDVRANISNVDENINENDYVSENTTSNKSNKTAGKSRKKKEQKQTIKSGAVKESRQMKKGTKSDKTQSTDDDDNETGTTGTNLKTADENSEKEDERNTDESEETESSSKKQTTKQSSKKTNKRKNASGKNVKCSDSVNEGKDSRKRKISSKEVEAFSDNDLDDNNTNDIDHHEESPGDKSQAKRKVVKKQKGKSLTENEQLESKRESKHVKNSGKIANDATSNKKLKRKSSSDMSDDCLADDSGREFQTKKAKKLIQRKSKGGKRKTSQKTVSSSSSDNGEVFENEDVTDHSKPMVDESAGRTPTVDSRLSVPSHFGSGVSFRVSRRSELLADVGSGYVGEGTVHTEPTGGLTPCISRPGAARKSKGRRVTICPEENIEHNISGDKSSDENSRNNNHFRWSTGTSVNATPLPDPDSTPVHYCETTHTATPGGKAEESVIEDRLIKPSPPEEGLRRSQRTRLKPIAWYKNEQVVFDYRRRSGPAIVGVKPSLEVKWNKLEEARRKKRLLRNQIRKAARPEKEDKPYRKLSIHKPLPNDIEVEEDQDPEITVFNQCLQAEDGIDCIGKRDAFRPVGPTHETPRKEDPYIITKLLDHPCMSAGKLHIKPNAEKPEQLVTGDYTLFFIEYGKMLVKLHKTSFLVETGDTFMVPIGNTYSISNLRADTAKLFYTVHKEVDDGDKSETPQLT